MTDTPAPAKLTFTIRDLLKWAPAIRELGSAKGIPFKVGLTLALILADVDAVLETFEKSRQKLLDSYTKKDAEGKAIPGVTVYTDEKALNAEFETLLDLDVTERIRFTKPIPVDSIGTPDVSPAAMSKLRWLITFE